MIQAEIELRKVIRGLPFNIQASIWSQCKEESLNFTRLEESFAYKPDRLLTVFSTHIKDLADATALIALGHEAIATRVYGGRMGNTEVGDGWTYRGRGLIMITGKENYEKYGALSGLDLVNDPDQASDPQIAAELALSYFEHTPGLWSAAEIGNVLLCTKFVNGGKNGLDVREANYKIFAL